MRKINFLFLVLLGFISFSLILYLDSSFNPPSYAYDCGNYDIIPHFDPVFPSLPSVDDIDYGGGGYSCTPSCGSCTPPPCPVDSFDGKPTSTTNRGMACSAPRTSCSRGSDGCGGSCGRKYRSCWYAENNPIPGTPTGIEYKTVNEDVEGTEEFIVCNLEDNIRVPYPKFTKTTTVEVRRGVTETNVEKLGGFLGLGGVDNRLGDIRGVTPTLRYRYRVPELSLQSDYILGTNYYSPEMEAVEGSLYTVHVLSNTLNRCQGNTSSPEISRTFQVNHIPKVISIEPVSSAGNPIVSDPNDSVSGKIGNSGEEHGFPCDVENPKTYKVVFEDQDGCGDIWEELEPKTPACDGKVDSHLELQAVEVGRESDEPFSHSSTPLSVSCSEEDKLTAYFVLEYEGEENLDLLIQAKARDILGDTSGWKGDIPWAYDAYSPDVLQLNPNIILGADIINLNWGLKDDISNLSGVRGFRLSASLDKGDILTGDSDYGSIWYGADSENTEEHEVEELFAGWESVWYDFRSNASDARSEKEITGTHYVDIGVNQDGFLNFRMEAVDRACNYISSPEDMGSLELGTPWVATRGGLVHSGEDIGLAIRYSLYEDIIPGIEGRYLSISDENTTLSTELVTFGGRDFLGFALSDTIGEDSEQLANPFYEIPSYKKILTHAWYPLFYSRAQARDSEGVAWTLVTQDSSEAVQILEEEIKSNCENRQHVYFVDGDLKVEPNEYELNYSTGSSGCIFVISGDLTISEGEYKSEDSDIPQYDLVRGYFIADGVIDLEFGDRGKETRDGLKVIGGLFATGGDKSVKLSRSLQLKDNLFYPTLIVFHDARFLDISRQILGDSLGGGYIRDIGFVE